MAQHSQGSVVNILMGRIADNPFIANNSDWAAFLLHLAVTGTGLILYIKSGVLQYVGNWIARQHKVAGFFYTQSAQAKTAIIIFKVFIGCACVFLLYNILLRTMQGLVPRIDFSMLILLVTIGGLGWFVTYPEPQKLPGFDGNLDNLNKTMWLRLSDNQGAYVQDREDRETWYLVKNKREINVSYTETYLFYERTFSNQIREDIISEDIIGKLFYSFRAEALMDNFPQTTSTEKLQALYRNFNSQEGLKKLLFLAIDKGALLKGSRNAIFESLNKYFDTDPNILHNQGHQRNRDFERILAGYGNFTDISGGIAKEIALYIEKLLGKANMFKISFEITRTAFNMDEMLKEIVDSRKRTAHQITQGNIDTQKSIVDTAIRIATTPGASPGRLKNMIDLLGGLGQTFSQQPKQFWVADHTNETMPENALKKVTAASHDVINAIFGIIESNPTPEQLSEAVALSTPYLSQNAIPPDAFIKRFFAKMSNEKTERTHEAYIKLAEDTLLEFTHKA
ncbi:hypothetical protein DLD77_05060 [Chitinophaga alhagiae]|uniref:Uncharacterized protein n=1 Tax=Chitinophaga alhagiae TaxID=2203219 RepID=A0ABM6WAZ5_9BACT|nr:hypothetical protein DLD77_05060 [Chitinophaga alhagiae]